MRDQLTTVLTSLAGCTGSRDLDLSVLMSQLGALDPPAPHQQGLQISPGPASTSSKGGAGPLQLWQHCSSQQLPTQQQDQQQQQQQVRPWCETCGRSYSTVGNLKQHVANVHGRGEWVTCGVCGKTFKTRQYLQSHLLQQHGIRQRPTPLLPGPGPSHHDPTQLPFPHESPSSSAQASTFSPTNRPFQSQTSTVNPSLPQPSVPAVFNNTIQSATDFANTTLNGHAHLPTFNQSSSSTSYSTSQPRNPNSALGPAPPQPDSSGQAASPPPQQVKQERFNSFQATHIKQEISHDNYYAI